MMLAFKIAWLLVAAGVVCFAVRETRAWLKNRHVQRGQAVIRRLEDEHYEGLKQSLLSFQEAKKT